MYQRKATAKQLSPCSLLTRGTKRVLQLYQDRRQQKRLSKIRRQLKVGDVTIISQNCIGGVFYHDMGMQFSSPTINLFFMEPDFVRFVMKLEHYLHCTLHVSMGSHYPIGTLDDITIHFMHYKTCQEAFTAWERRKQRVNLDRVLVVATDRNGFDDEAFRLWKDIPYPKVLFTVNPRYVEEVGTVFFSQFQDQPFVPDLIPNRHFYQNGVLLEAVNQLGGTANDQTGQSRQL